MKLALTLMVRDEADIIGPMLDHHFAQGVDVVIVTDNGSTDGTAEILQGYADRGLIDLRHDPLHRKQQSPVVTAMARDAATVHGADWVINADADEFFLPVDRSRTLREVFELLDPGIRSFLVPVTNLTGAPAAAGSGIQRLVYRDQRPEVLLLATGLHAHPTADAVHVGDPEVEVIQGNHFVSIASNGLPPEELAIEVLHLPWRSWAQYSHKVEVSGRAYDDNPELTPSPNHHGMRDYRRLQAGALLPFYLLRHPDAAQLAAGIAAGYFVEDRVLADALSSPVTDVPLDAEVLESFERFAPALRDAEARSAAAESRHRAELRTQRDELRTQREEFEAAAREREATATATLRAVEDQLTHARQENELTQKHVQSLETAVEELSARPEVRAGNRLRRLARRGRR